MATNPLIALRGDNLDPVGSYYNGQKMQQQSDLNKQNMKMNDEQLVAQRIANTSARDKARLQSIYYGAASLQPYLDNNDKEGALRLQMQRRDDLLKHGIDASDTEDSIQRITQDFESFKKLNKSVVDSGSLFGFAPRPENMGGATGHIIEKLMADNPGMSYTDALYMYQTGARNGLQRNSDGSVSTVPGYTQAQSDISQAKQAGKNYGDVQTARDVASSAPLPAPVMKEVNEIKQAIDTTELINGTLSKYINQLDNGELKLGLGENIKQTGRNAIGFSNEESRNFASFKADLEKQRNESLRLNNGVQTEGDAQRAWNELFENINDPKVVRQRLQEIQEINKKAAALRQNMIDSTLQDYGKNSQSYFGGGNAQQGGGGAANVQLPAGFEFD